MSLSLPNVTLCALTCINYELTVQAMIKCMEQCSFGDVMLISGRPIDAPFRVEVIPPFGGMEFAPFVCHQLTKYTSTDYNLMVQYDGFITDTAAWTDEFFEYDFVGAKWPWHPAGRRVGNSGFCLRSKRLLDVLSEIPLPPTGQFLDDTFVCHTIREPLEKIHHIKFATEEVADKFSYERHVPDRPTFGFHGMFNFWRHMSDTEMEQIVDQLDVLYVTSRPYAEVLYHYYSMRKFNVFYKWYARLRDHIGVPKLKDHFLCTVQDQKFVDELINAGEICHSIYDGTQHQPLPQSLAG